VALVGVLLFGTLYGLLLAVAMSVVGLVYRSGRLQVDVLGKVKGEKAAWGNLARNPKLGTVEGILVLRLSAPLFWVNCARATVLILDEVERAPGTNAVVISLEATNQLDTTSADEFGALVLRLRGRGIDVFVVRVMHPAREVLRSTGVLELIGNDHMWRTISQGVRAAKDAIKDQARPSE
jgi:MFS superfamily sulfate permease-like transporter